MNTLLNHLCEMHIVPEESWLVPLLGMVSACLLVLAVE